jgi:hypothetical protein
MSADDLQAFQAVVQCLYIDAVAIVVKVAQKQTDITTLLLSQVAHPLSKIQTILEVLNAIALESQVQICKHHGSLE